MLFIILNHVTCLWPFYSTPRERCTALLEDWVSTDNGVKPKTWKKLIEVLNEIEELEPVIEGIKQCLMSEGVTIDGKYVSTYVRTYVCMYVCMYVPYAWNIWQTLSLAIWEQTQVG